MGVGEYGGCCGFNKQHLGHVEHPDAPVVGAAEHEGPRAVHPHAPHPVLVVAERHEQLACRKDAMDE